MAAARRRILLRLLGGMAVVCAAVVASVAVGGLHLAAPSARAIGAPPPGLRGETVAIPSASGSLLQGWFIDSDAPGTVVLLHGVHASRLSMVRRARLLSAAGFAVLLFDFQAHGESSGRHITFGQLEALDAAAAVAYARERRPQGRLAVIGTSLGGAAALLGPTPLPVDALVLEGVFGDLRSALSNRLEITLGPAGRGLTPLFGVLAPVLLGIRLDDLRPIDRISGITAPVLIAAGTRDDRTRLAEARALFDRAREPKQFWAVAGAGHVDLEAYAPDDYRATVLPFLNRYLRPTGG
jgi:alpha-beta hydrolase superfamily lysophospholipase